MPTNSNSPEAALAEALRAGRLARAWLAINALPRDAVATRRRIVAALVPGLRRAGAPQSVIDALAQWTNGFNDICAPFLYRHILADARLRQGFRAAHTAAVAAIDLITDRHACDWDVSLIARAISRAVVARRPRHLNAASARLAESVAQLRDISRAFL